MCSRGTCHRSLRFKGGDRASPLPSSLPTREEPNQGLNMVRTDLSVGNGAGSRRGAIEIENGGNRIVPSAHSLPQSLGRSTESSLKLAKCMRWCRTGHALVWICTLRTCWGPWCGCWVVPWEFLGLGMLPGRTDALPQRRDVPPEMDNAALGVAGAAAPFGVPEHGPQL